MRIFLAGATGVIGVRLVPLLVERGHVVAGMTRSADKVARLHALGAEPVVCDAFDPDALTAAVVAFDPEFVMHQLTDLPDTLDQLPEFGPRNDRIRTEGTRNLLAAVRATRASRILAQSIAWTPARGGDSVAEHERLVLEAGGIVVRYGTFYGPGTYSGAEGLPPPPRIHVDEAAIRTVALLDSPSGVVVLVEDGQDPVGPSIEREMR